MNFYRLMLLFDLVCWGSIALYRGYRLVKGKQSLTLVPLVGSLTVVAFLLHHLSALPMSLRSLMLAAITVMGPVGLWLLFMMEATKRKARQLRL